MTYFKLSASTTNSNKQSYESTYVTSFEVNENVDVAKTIQNSMMAKFPLNNPRRGETVSSIKTTNGRNLFFSFEEISFSEFALADARNVVLSETIALFEVASEQAETIACEPEEEASVLDYNLAVM